MDKSNPVNPPCSEWKIWVGPEIEGHTDLGEMTLFIRDCFTIKAHEYLLMKYSRVWFCKEFITEKNYPTMRWVIAGPRTVCLEVTLDMLDTLPPDIYDDCQLYLKVEATLKPGDHVCMGLPFKDEAFLVGEGQRVKPTQYLQDERIL
jgi:hypothetical protein